MRHDRVGGDAEGVALDRRLHDGRSGECLAGELGVGGRGEQRARGRGNRRDAGEQAARRDRANDEDAFIGADEGRETGAWAVLGMRERRTWSGKQLTDFRTRHPAREGGAGACNTAHRVGSGTGRCCTDSRRKRHPGGSSRTGVCLVLGNFPASTLRDDPVRFMCTRGAELSRGQHVGDDDARDRAGGRPPDVAQLRVAAGHPHRLRGLDPGGPEHRECDGRPPASTPEDEHEQDSDGHEGDEGPHPELAVGGRAGHEREADEGPEIDRCDAGEEVTSRAHLASISPPPRQRL